MANRFTEYTDQALLNTMFGKTSNFGVAGSAPAIYVALSNTTPAADGTNVTEPSGNNYARVLANAATWNGATLADPSLIQNTGAINFATASGNWCGGTNLTYVVLYDSTTTGNCLGFGALSVPKPVLTGDTASFAQNTLQVTLA